MHVRYLAALALALALASCTALFLPTEARVATTLELSPREIVVRDQETVPLTVTLLDQHGEPFDPIPESMVVEWSISDPEIAFLRAGELKGQKQGSASVSVKVGELVAVSSVTVQGVARFLRNGGETRRSGVVGHPLAEPVAVQVVDRLGTGVGGVPVTFRITGGAGSVAEANVKSDSAGFARTLWTLGPRAGENSLEVVADSLEGEVVRFTASASPDAVARLERVAGDQQQAAAGSTLAQDLTVRAFDRNGNLVPNAPVTWSADGGAVTALSLGTDEAGLAKARWRLDTVARALSATARSGDAEVKFAARAVPGAPVNLRIAAGDRQSGPEFMPLADSLSVRVSDVHDNAVAGVPVTWLVTHGGGSVSAPRPSTTRADGTARASWTVGVSLPNAVTASAVGRTVTFASVPKPLVPRDTLRTASGVRYLEVALSTDSLIVASGDMVAVYFSAYLLDGTLIERVAGDDPPLRFIVGSGQVIVGFDEGVLGMRKESVRRIFLTPELGYRDAPVDHIPPNSTLVFDIQVVEVAKPGNGSPSAARIPGGRPRPREVPYPGDAR